MHRVTMNSGLVVYCYSVIDRESEEKGVSKRRGWGGWGMSNSCGISRTFY